MAAKISGPAARVKRATERRAAPADRADRLENPAVGRAVVGDAHDAKTESVFAERAAGAEILVNGLRALGRDGSPGR
jgi:hypothetical protein